MLLIFVLIQSNMLTFSEEIIVSKVNSSTSLMHKINLLVSKSVAEGGFVFHISVLYLFISAAYSLLSSYSAGAMLPKRGAGAVRRHETVCQSDWTN